MSLRMAVTAFVLCTLLAGVGHAHEMWIERDGETLTLLRGHTGRSHGEAQVEEYSTDEVIRVECFGVRAETLDVRVDRTYPLKETPEALRYAGKGHVQGKVVITVDHQNKT